MLNAILELLVKDKPLYSVYFTAEKYVKDLRGTKPPRRNEVTADERQTGS